jgi:hypothetical protein
MNDLPYVEASLLYLADENSLSHGATDATTGWPGQSGLHRVVIRDARPLILQLSLDLQGFSLLTSSSAVTNFYDRVEVEAVYYREVETLLKAATNASKVIVFAHDVRNAAAKGLANVRAPVTSIHNDYTEKSGPEFVRELLDTHEADARLRNRFVEINIWRPIAEPVRQMPLAVCDSLSIAPNDLIATAENLKHEVYLLRYNPQHRWFYFPSMMRNETILIKGFDSMRDGRARFTAHAAFDDPSTPRDAAPRESIEARAMLFF